MTLGQTGPISQVEEGMRVLDANGDEVGSVDLVKIGDPGAATAQGQGPDAETDPVSALWRTLGGWEPDVPPTIAARLLRLGFLKVDGRGLWGRDYYVAGDEIAEVSGDAVRLTVTRDQLTKG